MSGGVVAVVPIRSLTGGKTRLAGRLSPAERADLTGRMLRGVVRAALGSGVVDAVAVVSPDREARALAATLGTRITPLAQHPAAPGLNAALDAGRRWAEERGAAAMLVLFGDLPLLGGGDVRNLIRRDAPVVLAPDRHFTGTNALLLRLGGSRAGRRFRFGFGPGSYAWHVEEAHRLGQEVATAVSAGTAFDLDTPADLHLLDAGWSPDDLHDPALDRHLPVGAAAQ